MARLLTTINERKKVREEYRKFLEDDYVAQKRVEYEQALEAENKKNESNPYVPEISFNLLRAKYHDLKRGVDNLDYLKKAIVIEQQKQAEKKYLDDKYDYKNKTIVKPGQNLQQISPDETSSAAPEIPEANGQVISGFHSGILEQLNTGRFKISQQEVLRMHIKNWKMLNLKQKRKVLALLNARRARDAKQEFLKELNLLGQKIAHDNKLKAKIESTV